jgi:hypothetical protein
MTESPLSEDPVFTPGGDTRSIEGILGTFRIADAPKREQRRVLAAAWSRGPLRRILEPFADELRGRGLLD